MMKFIRTVGGIFHAIFTFFLFVFAGLVVIFDAIQGAILGYRD